MIPQSEKLAKLGDLAFHVVFAPSLRILGCTQSWTENRIPAIIRGMRDYATENLSHDPIHGYIAFTSNVGLDPGEVSERQIIDQPWLQRLRYIHQLQTAWWVFPSAEHTRFQHVLGVMHLASRAVTHLYDSLAEACDGVPSQAYVESLLRMAGLLHDVGHGPFGHFFDEHFLQDFGLTHETLGQSIIRNELGEMLSRVRRTPNGRLRDDERLDPNQVAWLIARPKGDDGDQPQWLRFLRSLLSGIYTIDNMDFVLRDAYMSGYSQRSFDLERLLHYSFFSPSGLTIHDRGIDALVRFMSVRAELFRSIYFHRTVRALDLTLTDLFADSKQFLFPGNPLDHLDEYQGLTDSSLLVGVATWRRSEDPRRRELGERWRSLLERRIPWKMVCQRLRVFSEDDAEGSSIFTDPAIVEQKIRERLPREISGLPIRVDIARHIFRPHTHGPSAGQNFLYDSAHDRVRPLAANQLFSRLPISHRVCRIYAETHNHDAELATALDALIGGSSEDDLTNM